MSYRKLQSVLIMVIIYHLGSYRSVFTFLVVSSHTTTPASHTHSWTWFLPNHFLRLSSDIPSSRKKFFYPHSLDHFSYNLSVPHTFISWNISRYKFSFDTWMHFIPLDFKFHEGRDFGYFLFIFSSISLTMLA